MKQIGRANTEKKHDRTLDRKIMTAMTTSEKILPFLDLALTWRVLSAIRKTQARQ